MAPGLKPTAQFGMKDQEHFGKIFVHDPGRSRDMTGKVVAVETAWMIQQCQKLCFKNFLFNKWSGVCL